MYRKLHQHLHTRVLIQLIIIFVAAIALAVAVVNDALQGSVGFVVMAIAAIVGIGIGLFSARMFQLKWHGETSKIIVQMDRLSFLLIGLYILFRILTTTLLHDYFNGAALSALTFTLLDGILIGRFVGMGRSIRKIFNEQGV